jgi:4-amino-4-deoxy-L-arabinose transferase-like glycosyltransferase
MPESVAHLAPRATARRPNTWWPDAVGAGAVVVLFCASLFIGLGRNDLQNDEAIYAYAIDRVLETGDWLTPRSIPSDNAFLEKPPLKFWLVAALIGAGLLPHDEFGMRFVDAVTGAVALLYVFFIGRHLAGPLCGVIAAFVLVTQGQLVFVQGLRSNNMESALLLSYCAGIFHFTRWAEDDSARVRSRHAFAVVAWFVLGFMTKFVAALFLPLVCVLALLWRPDRLALVKARWREWIAPLILAIVAIVPWFAYQTVKSGAGVWLVMFNQHVVTRLTSALDVNHLRPWNFYLTELWRELGCAGSQRIVGLGLCALVWAGWRERSWLPRLLLAWCVVPLAVISVGTSKLFHYMYPFMPPLALGAGFVAVRALKWVTAALAVPAASIGRVRESLRRFIPRSTLWRQAALVAGVLALLVAVWTAVKSTFLIEAGGIRVFKNASVLRPVLVMVVLWASAGRTRLAARAAVAVTVLAILPWRRYEQIFANLQVPRHPLRTVGDCIRALQTSNPVGARGVYNAATTITSHAYFYYWRDLGWGTADRRRVEEVRRRLVNAGAQSPVLLSEQDYDLWRQSSESREVGNALGRQPGGIAPDQSLIMLLLGRYEACVEPAVIAGARPVGGTPRAIGEAHR